MPPLSRAQLQRELSALLEHEETSAHWSEAGFQPDLELLGTLLRLTDPTNTTGASVATALDMWVAEQLRTAGLRHVLPRRHAPYYVEPVASLLHDQGLFGRITDALTSLESAEATLNLGLRTLVQSLSGPALAAQRRQAQQLDPQRIAIRTARRTLVSALRGLRREIERGSTTVLGEGRRKQVDVFLAARDRGLELAVSTKTLALGVAREGELLKNLPNRWEEFDGDLKNLRGRFPLAAIGALILVSETVLTSDRLLAVVDMMRKLTAPGRDWVNAYDAAVVVVVSNWTEAQEAGVRILTDEGLPASFPSDLRPTHFFSVLLEKVLERSPVSEHIEARQRRAEALGQDGAAYLKAGTAMASTETQPTLAGPTWTASG